MVLRARESLQEKTVRTFNVRFVGQHQREQQHPVRRDGGLGLLQHGARARAAVQQVQHAHAVEALLAPPLLRVQQPGTTTIVDVVISRCCYSPVVGGSKN